jgi:hypothetical protein
MGGGPQGRGKAPSPHKASRLRVLSLLQWFGLKIFKLQFRKLAAF